MLVIAAGGGGIPVVGDGGGLVGVEAVIDKDRCAAELALQTGADLLVLPTGVERVAFDYGTRWQRDMARLTVSDALRHLEEGEFPAGSMGPKIESAVRFVPSRRARVVTDRRAPGRRAGRRRRHVRRAGRGGPVAGRPGPRRRELAWATRVIRNRYADSVRLMGIARACARATASTGARSRWARRPTSRCWRGWAPAEATPGDVVIAVDARGPRRRGALAEAERAIAAAAGPAAADDAGRAPAPRSLVGGRRRASRSSRCPASTPRSRPTGR